MGARAGSVLCGIVPACDNDIHDCCFNHGTLLMGSHRAAFQYRRRQYMACIYVLIGLYDVGLLHMAMGR
jgi:hypothetical protein